MMAEAETCARRVGGCRHFFDARVVRTAMGDTTKTRGRRHRQQGARMFGYRVAVAALAVALLFGLRSGGDDPFITVGQGSSATVLAAHNGSDACADSFVVVIGAGPAGLAVSARLLHAGIPFALLERSKTAGSSWRSRYDRLHLHTHRDSSALPFLAFPDYFPTYVAAHDLADYYSGYAQLLPRSRLC